MFITNPWPARVLLILMCLYHLVAGVAATFFEELAVQIGSLAYGVEITMSPQAELMIRYLGAFAICLGVLAGLAALNPAKNKTIIYGAVVYFAIRAMDRLLFWDLFTEHAGGTNQNLGRIAGILVMGVGLLVLCPRARPTSRSASG